MRSRIGAGAILLCMLIGGSVWIFHTGKRFETALIDDSRPLPRAPRIREKFLLGLRLSFGELSPEQRSKLIDFRCITSKIHYQPGELVAYRVSLDPRTYDNKRSAKELMLTLRDASGGIVDQRVQPYGLAAVTTGNSGGSARRLTIGGAFGPLERPGSYEIEAISTDLRSGRLLVSKRPFVVSGPEDPASYETPFQYSKDFCIVWGHDARWHVFTTTGDLVGGHSWMDAGQERAFVHASSANLRDWTVHEPVISISDVRYSDGKGRYADRNVWAPHIVERQGTYYMFFTGVNDHLSQCIAMAASEDLFEWQLYAGNPVLTLEGVEWAQWSRRRRSDCRDPDILSAGGRYYMYFTASARRQGGSKRGVVAVAASDDLVHWSRPRVAVRGPAALESPQVWKMGDTYFMTTSARGAGTFTSTDPLQGWRPQAFRRRRFAEREMRFGSSRTLRRGGRSDVPEWRSRWSRH